MKNKIIKTFVLLFVIAFSTSLFSQEKVSIEKLQQEIQALKTQIENFSNSYGGETYDPLVPQLFAFDSKTQTIVAINKNENTIEILIRTKEGYEKDSVILVDKAEGRHDVYAIYIPQSVAIYNNHIIYLASNRDSSFVKVLNMMGEEKDEFRFNGAASSFSYDPSSKKLYIAGDNIAGYNVFAIDMSKGFEHIDIANSPSFNYIKPRKSEQIAKHDPYGVGLTVIAVSTVFLALIIITIVFKLFGSSLLIFQKRKAEKEKAKVSATPATKNVSDISGEEFAAIAAAIYMYNSELHDEENAILTINKVAKTYSPWSSKMYNMNVYRR